jgi:hypothetical protein
MRIGRVASRAGDDGVAGASCSAGIVHSLSAETNISTYYFSCLGEQAVNGSAKPTEMAVDGERLEAGFQ